MTLRIRETEVRKRELGVQDMQLRLRALKLEWQPNAAPQLPTVQQTLSSPCDSFDISRHIELVPPFRELEVDSNSCIQAHRNYFKLVWTLFNSEGGTHTS